MSYSTIYYDVLASIGFLQTASKITLNKRKDTGLLPKEILVDEED